MNLKSILSEKRDSILKNWFDTILNTYHPDTASFLKNQNDQFLNPVGSSFSRSMERLLEELLADELGIDKVEKYLEDIIKILALQGIAPSQSLSFIQELKDIVRTELKTEIISGRISDELTVFEKKIDSLLMLSFDIYMKYREKIYDLKANDLRNMTSKLIERANRIFEIYGKEKFQSEDIVQVDSDRKLEKIKEVTK